MQKPKLAADTGPVRTKHPPLPSAIRPIYWVLRTFGTLIGVAGVVLGALFIRSDMWATAAWSLSLGVLFAVLTWLAPTSRWQLPLLAVLGLGVGIFFQDWLIAALVLVAVAWGFWSRRGLGFMPKDFEVADPDATMKNACGFIDDYRALGFGQVGAYSAKIGPVRIVVSLLLAPDQKSYASVTDAVLTVTSWFPEGRSMVTRNINERALPDEVLINPVPGGEPDELVASHTRALEILADHGHFPHEVAAPELARMAIDSELRTIEWTKGEGRNYRHDDVEALTDRPDLAERISRWHGSGEA